MLKRLTLPCLAVLLAAPAVSAKPIAFADGTTAMLEYGGDTMQEAQVFYAPSVRYSLGAGQLRLDAEEGAFTRNISYVRTNVLLKRWNLPRAQGNVFAFSGLGRAQSRQSGSDVGIDTVGQVGVQADYETLRIYTSGKVEWHHAESFTHRISTVQAGFAPYPHRYDGIATWLIAQGRQTTGGVYDGIEGALLLRLFAARRWGSVWVEAGPTTDGKLQAMTMFNF